jgi:hypothetical protein
LLCGFSNRARSCATLVDELRLGFEYRGEPPRQ